MELTQQDDQDRVAQMIQTGYPPEGRLDPHLKAGFYSIMTRRLAVRPAFPIAILAFLCAGLLGLNFLTLTVWIGWSPWLNIPLVMLVLGCIFVMNMISLPVSGFIIVTRRKNAKLDL